MTIETYVALAAKRDAERSGVGGDLGWYLRHEFRGGTTLEAILAENGVGGNALRAALSRAFKALRFSRGQTTSDGRQGNSALVDSNL